MDDFSFDSFIRRKMKDYKCSSYNAGAFSELQARLAPGISIPWYVTHRTALVATATLIASMFLNFYVINPNISKEGKDIAVALHLSQVIDSLNLVIRKLEKRTPAKVYVVDPTTTKHDFTTDPIAGISNWLIPADTGQNSNLKLLLGSEVDLSREVFNTLQKWNLIERNGNEVWLVISRDAPGDHLVPARRDAVELLPLQNSIASVRDTINMTALSGRSKSRVEISGKLKNSIEKHYFNGVGINLAPHCDLVIGDFGTGSRRIIPRVGILADWVMSPRFSIETGIDYSVPKFTIRDNFKELELNYDSPVGTLQSAEIGVRAISLPVASKFRCWLTEKDQLTVRVGVTPYFAFRHQYVYTYTPVNQRPDDDLTITMVEQTDEMAYYASTLSLSAGITRQLKNNRKLEISLYGERSLAAKISEANDMTFFGLKTAYWLKLR